MLCSGENDWVAVLVAEGCILDSRASKLPSEGIDVGYAASCIAGNLQALSVLLLLVLRDVCRMQA